MKLPQHCLACEKKVIEGLVGGGAGGIELLGFDVCLSTAKEAHRRIVLLAGVCLLDSVPQCR